MENTERHILVLVSELSHFLGAMELALGRHGYRVRFASDREEALELSSRQVFDLVITDRETLRTEGASLVPAVQAHCPCASIMILHGDEGPQASRGRASREQGYDLIEPACMAGCGADVASTLACRWAPEAMGDSPGAPG